MACFLSPLLYLYGYNTEKRLICPVRFSQVLEFEILRKSEKQTTGGVFVQLLKYILIAGFLVGLFIGIQFLMVVWNQEDQLFFETTISEQHQDEAAENAAIEEIRLTTADQEELHGWLRHPVDAADEPMPLLLYFGGNAEEKTQAALSHDWIEGYRIAFINYRGYGLSSGSPGENELFADSELIFDRLVERDDVSEDQVVSFGRSMGSAPATHLATARDLAGTILAAPYDSRVRVQEHRHPWLPIGPFIRHPFEVSTMAEEIGSPLLILTGTDDQVIPPEHSAVTADSWQGEVTANQYEGFGHNDMQMHPDYQGDIQAFLDELQ
ncbi:alpha/beta hydrolase [Salisediminibacterium beveridgei]|uniref:alpha/beta hydrolase n=1 Tax=Salisediminibacterium beveridgei TaxID=632773 RepID=UPI0012EDA76D|nr:alpha/beta hydrolase [Salisediminibacterium beveridgei]